MLPRASRKCRGSGRARALGPAAGGVRNGRGSGVWYLALGKGLLPKVGTSACVAVTALLRRVTHCSGLYPSPGGRL